MNEDVKALRERYNLTRKQFTETFGIPYRTVQDWELGSRKCPDYLLRLIEFRLKNDKQLHKAKDNMQKEQP